MRERWRGYYSADDRSVVVRWKRVLDGYVRSRDLQEDCYFLERA